MIVAEYQGRGVVVRIHDECIAESAEQCLSELGRIVSNAYRRRELAQGPGVAAMGSDEGGGQTLA